MVLTFPNDDLFAALRIADASFRLEAQQELRRQGSGAVQARGLSSSIWCADVTSAEMPLDDFEEAMGRIEALDGSIQPFLMWNPARPFPRLDPLGTVLGASTVTIRSLNADNKRLALEGLPAGYVLSPGDMIAFAYGSNPVNRALHRIVEPSTVTADGSGDTTEFEVRPHIRPGALAGDVVELARPAAMFNLMPRSLRTSVRDVRGSLSFSAVQHIR